MTVDISASIHHEVFCTLTPKWYELQYYTQQTRQQKMVHQKLGTTSLFTKYTPQVWLWSSCNRKGTLSISQISSWQPSELMLRSWFIFGGEGIFYNVLHHDKSHGSWSLKVKTLLTSKKFPFVGHALIILFWDLVWLNYRKLQILHFEQTSSSWLLIFFKLHSSYPQPSYIWRRKRKSTVTQAEVTLFSCFPKH